MTDTAVPSEKQDLKTENKEKAGFLPTDDKVENEEQNPKYYVPSSSFHDERAGSGLEAIIPTPLPETTSGLGAVTPNTPADSKSYYAGCRSIEPDSGVTPEVLKGSSGYSADETKWQSEFYDCITPGGLFVEAFTCPCILAGRTHTRLHNPNAEHLASTNAYCASCFVLTLTMIAALPLYCFMTVASRREIRYRYHIDGSNIEDCWKATFCPCCSLLQEEKEVLWQLARAKETNGYSRREDKMEYKGA